MEDDRAAPLLKKRCVAEDSRTLPHPVFELGPSKGPGGAGRGRFTQVNSVAFLSSGLLSTPFLYSLSYSATEDCKKRLQLGVDEPMEFLPFIDHPGTTLSVSF